MKKPIKISLGILGIILLALVLVVGGYVIYMQNSYYRIPDHQKLTVKNNQSGELQVGKKYTAATYNVGFGAYNQKFSFFMDTGELKNGTKTRGKHGTAFSKQAVLTATNGALSTMQKTKADFMLFQEIDTNSTRSYHVNQVAMAEKKFRQDGSVFANNFHSAFLFWPLTDPHGSVQSGLLTLSHYHIKSSVRRSYPVTHSFIGKFTDLDRCFSLTRIPVKNGKQLILINSHMSAYDKGGESKKKQLKLLNSVMKHEYQKGNYVIVGGDFNHALGKKYLTHFKTAEKVPSTVAVLTNKELKSSGMHIVEADNANSVATNRSDDLPYKKNYNYTTVIDGYLVSPNVAATAHVINTEFRYSDHNPVKLTFTLK